MLTSYMLTSIADSKSTFKQQWVIFWLNGRFNFEDERFSKWNLVPVFYFSCVFLVLCNSNDISIGGVNKRCYVEPVFFNRLCEERLLFIFREVVGFKSEASLEGDSSMDISWGFCWCVIYSFLIFKIFKLTFSADRI